jgi:hypothetical protein
LVVVDSISGQIVISNTESRALVMRTCQEGTAESIGSMFSGHWLNKIPTESQQLMNLLETSNAELGSNRVETLPTVEYCSYLVRDKFIEEEKRVEMLVEQLVEDHDDNMNEEEAYDIARQAVKLSMMDDDDNLKESCLDGLFQKLIIRDTSTKGVSSTSPAEIAEQILISNGTVQLVAAIVTIRKYFNKCYTEPWNPKYRKFQLSFKVADQITKVNGSIELILSMGFEVYCNTDDYVACIPITLDLDHVRKLIASLCTQFNVTA